MAQKKVKKSPAKKSSAKKPTSKKPVKIAAKKTAPKTPAKVATKPAATKNLSAILSPLDDRVLIRLEEGEKITAGGIILPDTAGTGGNIRGVVVAIGRGHLSPKGHIRPLDLKIGDRVLLAEFAGEEIQVGGQTVKIVRESDVLGVVQKN